MTLKWWRKRITSLIISSQEPVRQKNVVNSREKKSWAENQYKEKSDEIHKKWERLSEKYQEKLDLRARKWARCEGNISEKKQGKYRRFSTGRIYSIESKLPAQFLFNCEWCNGSASFDCSQLKVDRKILPSRRLPNLLVKVYQRT